MSVVVGVVELGGFVSEYDMATAKCEWQDILRGYAVILLVGFGGRSSYESHTYTCPLDMRRNTRCRQPRRAFNGKERFESRHSHQRRPTQSRELAEPAERRLERAGYRILLL
jgi:hypothetical protein